MRYLLHMDRTRLTSLPVTTHFVSCVLASLPMKSSSIIRITDEKNNELLHSIALMEPDRKIYFSEVFRHLLGVGRSKFWRLPLQSLIKGMKERDRVYFSKSMYTSEWADWIRCRDKLKVMQVGDEVCIYQLHYEQTTGNI